MDIRAVSIHSPAKTKAKACLVHPCVLELRIDCRRLDHGFSSDYVYLLLASLFVSFNYFANSNSFGFFLYPRLCYVSVLCFTRRLIYLHIISVSKYKPSESEVVIYTSLFFFYENIST
jgi:hypothetical protein